MLCARFSTKEVISLLLVVEHLELSDLKSFRQLTWFSTGRLQPTKNQKTLQFENAI